MRLVIQRFFFDNSIRSGDRQIVAYNSSCAVVLLQCFNYYMCHYTSQTAWTASDKLVHYTDEQVGYCTIPMPKRRLSGNENFSFFYCRPIQIISEHERESSESV